MDTLRQKIDTALIRDSQDEASAEANSAKLSERQRRHKIREHNRELWIDYYSNLAEALALRSAEYQRKARALEAKPGGARERRFEEFRVEGVRT